MKKPLIIGGNGTIGSALHARINGVAFTRADLDLSVNPASWKSLPECDVAFLCAAETKLDACENNPEATRIVNVAHMKLLAEKLFAERAFVIFLSSNQVFDGKVPHAKTTDEPSPMNEYGRQKAEFEQWLLPRGGAVLRLTKVISEPLPIVSEWKEKIARGEIIEAFDDLVFSPLPLTSAIEGLEIIAHEKRAGISHLSGSRDVSYFEIAKQIAGPLARPISAISKGIRPQFLPKHGTLASSDLGIVIPDAAKIISENMA